MGEYLNLHLHLHLSLSLSLSLWPSLWLTCAMGEPPACGNRARDDRASNVPQFSSLQQLTAAIKEAGQRKDWKKAVALLEGKYGVLAKAYRGSLTAMSLCSLRTRRQSATQCVHLQCCNRRVRECSAVGTRMRLAGTLL